MLRKILLVLCFSFGILLPFALYATNTFVATYGSDGSDCLTSTTPCRTIQAGVDKTGGKGLVKIAAGAYQAGANLGSHFMDITIEGVCGDNNAVVINAIVAGPIFWVQDNSIGIIRCLRLTPFVNGVIGIAARQFSIVDYSEINFDAFPLGGHVQAAEMSKINCGGAIVIYGSAVYHGNASGMSTLSLPCQISYANNPSFSVFVIGSENSFVNALSTVHIGLSGGCIPFVMQTSLIRLNPSYAIPCGGATGQVYYGGQAY